MSRVYVDFEFTTPLTSSVAVEATSDRGLAVAIEVKNTVEDLIALENALRKIVLELGEQRAFVIELAAEGR